RPHSRLGMARPRQRHLGATAAAACGHADYAASWPKWCQRRNRARVDHFFICCPVPQGKTDKLSWLIITSDRHNGGALMPYGGNDWLALTQEPTLEPEISICDPHHHFWDLRPERIPYQRYLLHELIADINCGHNVRSTVFIETRGMYRPDGPVEMRPVGEV